MEAPFWLALAVFVLSGLGGLAFTVFGEVTSLFRAIRAFVPQK
jgi:hypothetical protein